MCFVSIYLHVSRLSTFDLKFDSNYSPEILNLFIRLSFVWMIQRKSLHTIWSEREQEVYNENEVPNMHPRVRTDYENSLDERQSRSNNISNISSIVEQPPNYEDALIDSKPINWIYLGAGKNSSRTGSTDIPDIHIFPHYKNNLAASNEIQNSFHISSASSSITQIAMSIVKNFTSIGPASSTTMPQVIRSQSLPEYNSVTSPNTQQRRKPSYCQLDVSQLMLAESPPRYSELTFANESYVSRGRNSID